MKNPRIRRKDKDFSISPYLRLDFFRVTVGVWPFSVVLETNKETKTASRTGRMEPTARPAVKQALQQDEVLFEQLFKTYFKALHGYAFSFVQDTAVAEDVVQTLFLRLWERAEDLEITGSLQGYLYRSVYNECLNHLKHNKVKATHVRYVQRQGDVRSDQPLDAVHQQQLEERLSEALKTLPEGCRTVFQLSRFESLKYQEIAERLGISIKTVENQMGKALRLLRLQLADFLPVLFIFALIYLS